LHLGRTNLWQGDERGRFFGAERDGFVEGIGKKEIVALNEEKKGDGAEII